MYDTFEEIEFIINLLLKNDKKNNFKKIFLIYILNQLKKMILLIKNFISKTYFKRNSRLYILYER